MNTAEVLVYLKESYNVAVTPQTVRNWRIKGRAGILLPEKPTEKQLDNFIGAVGTYLGKGRPKGT